MASVFRRKQLVRRQRTAAIVLTALVVAAAPTWAANGNIGMFFDTGAALCQAAVPCGSPVTMYVYGLLQGASITGITGAEYKIQIGTNNNPDPGWFFGESFDPAATVVGSGAMTPVDNGLRGVNVAWPTCQMGDGTKVLIETVMILNMCDPAELALKVVKHDAATNQFFQCPLFALCDEPVFTKVCLGSNLALCRNPEPPNPNNATCSTSGQAYLNPGPTRNCTVGVETTSWSSVKGLYQD